MQETLGIGAGEMTDLLGYRQGAIVAGHWLREYAADPGAPSTEDLSFVLVGNPARAFGGAYVPLGDTTPQTQYVFVGRRSYTRTHVR